MYKAKLDELFKKVKQMNDIEIHSAVINPPLSKQKLKQLGDEFKIPEDMLLFYSEVNGCQISYTFKTNRDFDKEKFGYYDDASFPAMWPNENYWHLDGCINILPVEFVFKNNWQDYIWFDNIAKNEIVYNNNQVVQADFEKQLKPFDLFSKDSIAVIYPVSDSADVLLSTDHNASYVDFLPITIDTYLDGIVDTAGIVDKRKDIFKKIN